MSERTSPDAGTSTNVYVRERESRAGERSNEIAISRGKWYSTFEHKVNEKRITADTRILIRVSARTYQDGEAVASSDGKGTYQARGLLAILIHKFDFSFKINEMPAKTRHSIITTCYINRPCNVIYI